ncbi:MAG TPA: N-acetyltransferase [Candidatus Acidoferrales bacterium]|nr:N-acetyltransferase [Candidatus Acidoferrales bacterium]
MKLVLRDYRPADLETLYRIDRACFEPGIAYSRRMLREFLELPVARCHVACLADEIVGFLIAASAGDRAHIITIDVVESARRSGVGSGLLARAEEELARNGVRLVELETATTNQTAVAFWRRHGYRIAGVCPRYYAGRIDAFLMRKPLEAPRATED